jgi:O-antigen ligase
LNSQIVGVDQALRSNKTFIVLTSLIPVSLFLKAGFVSFSVLWFFAICVYNYQPTDLKRHFRTYYILCFPILLFILHLIGIFFSDNLTGLADLLLRKIHFILIPLGFIVVTKQINHKFLQAILMVFLAVCLVSSFICYAFAIFNVILHKSWVYHTIHRDYYYFFSYSLTDSIDLSPIYLSIFCNFALLITFDTPLIKKPVYKTAIILHLMIFILMIGAATGILCMIILTIIWSFNIGRNRRSLIIWAATVAIVLPMLMLNTSFVKEKAFDVVKFNYTDEAGQLQPHTADKMIIWSAAVEAIKQSPVFGYGTGDGQSALEKIYSEKGLVWEVKNSLNPHQEFLSTTLDLGVPGLACIVLMLFVPFVEAVRAKDLFAIGFLIIVTLFFFGESVLQRQKGIVFFSYFYSLLFCHLAVKRTTEHPK